MILIYLQILFRVESVKNMKIMSLDHRKYFKGDLTSSSIRILNTRRQVVMY